MTRRPRLSCFKILGLFICFQVIAVHGRKLAKLKDGVDGVCMTECINSSCRIGRNETDVAECYLTKEDAPIYFTSEHQQKEDGICVGECAEAGFDYNWCFTQSGAWDKCSREHGKAASGKDCQTPCLYTGNDYYNCTTSFNQNDNFDEPCSPVTINEPSGLDKVAKMKKVQGKGTCMSPCTGTCWFGWGTDDWDECTPSKTLRRQYYTSFNAQKTVALCSGECNQAGYEYNWCYTVNQVSWDYCSRYDGKSYFNKVKCKSECAIQEQKYYTCETGGKAEICSPKPIDLAKGFEINQKLQNASDSSDMLSFAMLFDEVKSVFHKTIVDDTEEGGANVTYYHDYVDGVKIIRGLEVNVSREFILNRNITEEYDDVSQLRLPYQAKHDDILGLFLEKGLGGPNEHVNFVPLEKKSAYQEIQKNITKKVQMDENISSITFISIPIYTFNGHRPLGFVTIAAFKDTAGHFDISFIIIQHNSVTLTEYKKHDHDKTPPKGAQILNILHWIVISIGVVAFGFISYNYYLKKMEK